MGKSKKKIKADQINILRKQYDAFLEEDKKRKERNEHILDKLDKIRLSYTVARYKSNTFLEPRESFNCAEEPLIKTYPHPQSDRQLTGVSLRKFKDPLVSAVLNAPAKPLDETYILNEISKKYILIPKLRSVVSEDYVSRAIQDNNNDIDWKSKYSILDKLKQSEKEETHNLSGLQNRSETFLDDIPSKEPKCRDDDETIAISSTRKFDETRRDMSHINNATNRLASLEDDGMHDATDTGKENDGQSHKTLNLNTNTSRTLKPDIERVGRNQEASGEQGQFCPGRVQYNYPTANVHGHVAPVSENIGDQQNDVLYSDKHENEDNEKISPVVDDIRHVEVIDAIKPAAQKTNIDNQNIGNSETQEYPIDIINVKDFTPVEGVPLVDGVNVNPEHNLKQAHLAPEQPASAPPVPADQAHFPGANKHPGGDHYVSEPTASAEEAYLPRDDQLPRGDQYDYEPIEVTAEHKDNVSENTEQQLPQEGAYDPDAVTSEIEAFEAEQNQMFYNEQAYQDQDGLGDVYSPETGNYDPALYYAGEQQETGYPAEINEHEEASQRYDPSYEEQYAGKASEHEQYPQQYADPQQYEQQQYNEQRYSEEQQYGEQQYGAQQNYEEQHYADEQPYADQQVEQIQGESGMVTTAQDYGQEPIEALHEQQAMEQIEQQLDNEEFGVPHQDGGVGDIVDESVLYTQSSQDAADVAASDPYVETQNVQNPQPAS